MAGPGSTPRGAQGAHPEHSNGPPSSRRFRVVVVDDDIDALHDISTILATDMDVVTCTTAEQALKLLSASRFHLICVSLGGSGTGGVELLDRATQLHQGTSGLLITASEGYSRGQKQSRHHVLLRPFDAARLRSLALRLAQLTEMKRSVQSLTDSVMAPDSSRAAPPSSRRLSEASPQSEPTGQRSSRPPGDPPERPHDVPPPPSSRDVRR
ncbi:response regulator [Chondromyces apiculatus]|uniref:RedD n=1 Tax=Chondromyces apiculatus DSM 436 TaxID=1192034 RepID=A0A017T1A2_9BACT|nr:response regulator [Chondromyces apiculatus]EYF02346.1 RedD [Chondromyces apiculatus DSM 436]